MRMSLLWVNFVGEKLLVGDISIVTDYGKKFYYYLLLKHVMVCVGWKVGGGSLAAFFPSLPWSDKLRIYCGLKFYCRLLNRGL
jgi:hypothetical protein